MLICVLGIEIHFYYNIYKIKIYNLKRELINKLINSDASIKVNKCNIYKFDKH